jgi:hypothetical protein
MMCVMSEFSFSLWQVYVQVFINFHLHTQVTFVAVIGNAINGTYQTEPIFKLISLWN